MYETMVVWETDPILGARPGVSADFARTWQAADKVVYSAMLSPAVPTRRTRVERVCSSIEPVGSPANSCTIWYMINEGTVEIDAPVERVWQVFADVERWPEWTASIRRIEALDGPGVAVGKRFRIAQPRLPTLVWEVTEVDPGRSWTWRQRSPGATTEARHDVGSAGTGRAVAHQRLDQRGPVGALVGALTRRLTRRYLDLEARGLKARCEGRPRPEGAGS
jgi:uncharacterized protein YndB with AHSA1/START domain